MIDTVYGLQANMANQVNRNPILPAPTVLLRMAPVWQTLGLTSRRAQFDATYSCTIKFHYGGQPRYKMLEQGNQGNRLAFPFEDPLLQVAVDDRHYHSDVHAENFVMPMTGYVINESDKVSDLPAKYSIIPARSSVKTTADKVQAKLIEKGFKVQEEDIGEVGATTSVKSLFDNTSTKPQVEPEFRKEILTGVGFSEEDIGEIDEWVKDHTDGNITDTTGEKPLKFNDGFITDAADHPKLLVVASIDVNDNVELTNFEGLRPGEAWKTIGTDVYPANPRRDGASVV